METFLSVVRKRSISKAAAELYATQPTISLRVKRLESELGFEILTRSWRGVELTPQGRHIVPIIADHILRLKSAVDLAKNGSTESGPRVSSTLMQHRPQWPSTNGWWAEASPSSSRRSADSKEFT